MSKSAKTPVVAVLFAFLLIVVLSIASRSSHAAQAEPDAVVRFLTGSNDGAPLDIALGYIYKNEAALGLTSADLVDVTVTDHYMSQHNGVSHIYLRQRYQGIEVHGANMNINIASDGSVINLGNSFVPNLSQAINTTRPAIPPDQAVNSAAGSLGLAMKESLSVLNFGPDADGLVLSTGGISRKPIPVKLVYQPVAEGDVRLSWDLEIYELDAQHYWSMRVDAQTGQVLSQDDFVNHDNWGEVAGKAAALEAPTVPALAQGFENLLDEKYRVYALPLESPNHGGRTLVMNPADLTASPFGWHDDDGIAGADYTVTRGNNVDAYEDDDGNNLPGVGSRADGGGTLDFDFPLDLTQEPDAYQAAAVTNLFYWNNVTHDVMYQYGFDETSGNFQVTNYGGTGAGGDDVRAEAQDGGGNCNANFFSPSDGSRPRMQMFTCNNVSPARDGDLDNGVIVHEYGHGISQRLTGGPAAASCLTNGEQPGEGWSDWLALMMTIESGDAGADARGIGTYLFGEDADGPGIRQYRYSTDMGINPHTYDDIILNSVHGIGSVWAAMIWEVTWKLIEEYGFHPDLYNENGGGGNNIAMQLIIDGMKMQPCSPGFVDARDAILSADQANNGGVNQCRIWEAFAKRGLGANASQGNSNYSWDGTENFDLPSACSSLTINKTANPVPVEAGTNLTYSLLVENNTASSLTGVTATDDVPANTTYVASATCGGIESGGTVTFPIGEMNSGASQTCTFEVTVDVSAASPVLFSDDMEDGETDWTVSGSGNGGWSLDTTNPHSLTSSWFAPDVIGDGDHYLSLTNTVSIGSDTALRFWHEYNTEANWDGGVVEIFTDGGASWTDLGPDMVANGYNSTINPTTSSPLAGLEAFSGSSDGFVETWVDLGSYAGNSAQIRFRFATDQLEGGDGWYIDDVEIFDNGIVTNTACVTATEGDNDCDTMKTPVTPATGPTPPDIDVTPTSLSETLEPPDAISNQNLTIDNLGSLDLIWDVKEDTDPSCDSPGDDVPWLTESTVGGTTGGGSSDQVIVTFNSAGLAEDTYSAALCINSDDPDEALVVVPVDLTVEAIPPDIDVTPTSLSKTLEPEPGQVSNQNLTIDNLGSLDLIWDVKEDTDPSCDSPGDDVPWLTESTVGGTTGGGSSSQVIVTFASAGLAEATYSAALCINSDDPDEALVVVPVDLTVETTPTFFTQSANGEIFVEGSVSGDYLLTQDDEGSAQELTEAPKTNGNPAKRRDSGEHIWTFPTDSGIDVNFFANTWISQVGDGENFDWYYSVDNVIWDYMFTVSSENLSNTETASLVNVGPGDTTVYVRVEDTDFTQGNNNPDSLSIDYMHITDVSGTGGNVPPMAGFSYVKDLLEVTFTDQSVDPDDDIVTWEWDFGDTMTSTLPSLAYTYAVSGTYSVQLTVTDSADGSDSVIQDVTVSDTGPISMTVGSLDPSSSSQGRTWTGFVDILVEDDLGGVVAGATVSGTFTAGDLPSSFCVTDTSGSCTLDNGGGVRKNVGSVDFTVNNVTGPLPYPPPPTQPTVTVFKP